MPNTLPTSPSRSACMLPDSATFTNEANWVKFASASTSQTALLFVNGAPLLFKPLRLVLDEVDDAAKDFDVKSDEIVWGASMGLGF